MNDSQHNIEYLLKSKEYFELSSDELAIISAEIKDEQEYNQLKNLIVSITDDPTENQLIEPPIELKNSLLEEFRKTNSKNKIWLNGIVTTLFPLDKKVVSMPGTQLIGIAASLAIILTIYLNVNPSESSSEISMTSKELDKIDFPEESSIIENSNGVSQPVANTKPTTTAEESSSFNKAKPEKLISKIDDTKEVPIKTKISPVLDEIYLEDHSPSYTTTVAEDLAISSYEITKEDVMLESTAEVSRIISENEESLVLSGYTAPSADSPKHSESIKITTVSRSLNEDKELIALFYTAL